jgi:hypothetical protein
MPLQRFDLIAGRTSAEVQSLLDAAQRAVVAAFGVPPSDLYQIVHQHSPHELAAKDTGLGIPRSDKLVFLSMTSRPRGESAKLRTRAGPIHHRRTLNIGPDDGRRRHALVAPLRLSAAAPQRLSKEQVMPRPRGAQATVSMPSLKKPS